jgi:polyhydroxybutyrate depolymerase
LATDLTVEIEDTSRVYDVYVPATHWADEEASAVVVLLHGQRSSREDLEGRSIAVSPYSEWQNVADANNLLLMIPQGVDGTNGHAGWNDCRADVVGNPTTDDVAFITTALDEMAETYLVDTERVFAVGTSNGGHMAIRLAQEAPDRLAGIGVIAAGMPANITCVDSDVPMSAAFMWGTEDPIAPYEGGAMVSDRGEILSADASIQYWVERNGTSTEPSVTAFPDIDSGDDSTVDRFVYEGGTGDSRVALFRVTGAGHAEPSINHQYRRLFERVAGGQNHDIEMALEMWAVLAGDS